MRTRNFFESTVAMAVLVLVLPTLPATATSLMSGCLARYFRTDDSSWDWMKDLNIIFTHHTRFDEPYLEQEASKYESGSDDKHE